MTVPACGCDRSTAITSGASTWSLRARLRLVQAQTHDGRLLRVLTLIDEHGRTCLALTVARRLNGLGVVEALPAAMGLHGIPEHIRCDNGPEMIAKALRNTKSR